MDHIETPIPSQPIKPPVSETVKPVVSPAVAAFLEYVGNTNAYGKPIPEGRVALLLHAPASPQKDDLVGKLKKTGLLTREQEEGLLKEGRFHAYVRYLLERRKELTMTPKLFPVKEYDRAVLSRLLSYPDEFLAKIYQDYPQFKPFLHEVERLFTAKPAWMQTMEDVVKFGKTAQKTVSVTARRIGEEAGVFRKTVREKTGIIKEKAEVNIKRNIEIAFQRAKNDYVKFRQWQEQQKIWWESMAGRKKRLILRSKIDRLVVRSIVGVNLAAMMAFALVLPPSVYTAAVAPSLPSIDNLPQMAQQEQAIRIFDAYGQQMATRFSEEGGFKQYISLDDVSPYAIAVVVVTEDETFYRNPGFAPKGMVRAFADWVLYGKESGASSITQQLARNLLFDPKFASQREGLRGLDRKAKEILLAQEITQNYTKDQILEMYLNTVYFGNNAYGIEAAVQVYFKKDAKDLSLAESAFLAGLIQAPGLYDPFTHPQAAFDRLKAVLPNMIEKGCIDIPQATVCMTHDAALQVINEMTQIKFERPQFIAQHPYFIAAIYDQLGKQYGEAMYQEGFNISSTVNPDIQALAEQMAEKSKENDSIAVIDAKNGGILAMAGDFSPLGVAIQSGGESFTLVDLALAFSLEHEGTAIHPTVISKITDSTGEKILCESPTSADDLAACPSVEIKNAKLEGVELKLFPYPVVLNEVEIQGKIYQLMLGKKGDTVVAILSGGDTATTIEMMGTVMQVTAQTESSDSHYSPVGHKKSKGTGLPPHTVLGNKPVTVQLGSFTDKSGKITNDRKQQAQQHFQRANLKNQQRQAQTVPRGRGGRY